MAGRRCGWRLCGLFGVVILVSGCAQHGDGQSKAGGFLERPFEGDYPDGWPFDHDLPLNVFSSAMMSSPGVLTWRGDNVVLPWGEGDGHDGHDWQLPEGTPLVATADGVVTVAGLDRPVRCGDRDVQAVVLRLRHDRPDGEVFESIYGHLSVLQVAVGDQVRGGQRVGLSGSTGCASGPHVHFGVRRLTGTNSGEPAIVDPFGWQGRFPDPWALHPRGAESRWLWRGAAPAGDFLLRSGRAPDQTGPSAAGEK